MMNSYDAKTQCHCEGGDWEFTLFCFVIFSIRHVRVQLCVLRPLLAPENAEVNESDDDSDSSSRTLELAPQPKKRPRILKMVSEEVAKGPDPPTAEN